MPSATNIQYGPESYHLLDWYAPASPLSCCVILIHGGAWSGTGRAVYKDTYDTIDNLNAAGITAITIDYTFADIDQQVKDIDMAVDWVKANLGFSKMVFWGDSAGAHLSLLAIRKNARKGVLGVVANSGPLDLVAMREPLTPAIMNIVMRSEANEEPDKWRRLSPMRITRALSRLVASFVIAETEDDPLVPRELHGDRFVKLMQRRGKVVTHLVVPGSGHAHMTETESVGIELVKSLS